MFINLIPQLAKRVFGEKGTPKRNKKRAKRRIVTLQNVAKLYPAFPIKRLRWYRQNNTGGFNKCIRKVGRRLYVDLDAFEAWVDGQGGK